MARPVFGELRMDTLAEWLRRGLLSWWGLPAQVRILQVSHLSCPPHRAPRKLLEMEHSKRGRPELLHYSMPCGLSPRASTNSAQRLAPPQLPTKPSRPASRRASQQARVASQPCACAPLVQFCDGAAARVHDGNVAQMAERSLSKREVGGSIPPFSIVQLAQMAERGALDSVAAGSIPALDPSHCSCGANGSAPGYELGGCRFESCHGPCTMTVDLMGMVPQPVS